MPCVFAVEMPGDEAKCHNADDCQRKPDHGPDLIAIVEPADILEAGSSQGRILRHLAHGIPGPVQDALHSSFEKTDGKLIFPQCDLFCMVEEDAGQAAALSHVANKTPSAALQNVQ